MSGTSCSGTPVGSARSPPRPDRALTSVGKFHWLCWQQQLDWADRFRPDRVLDLTSDDFVAWAEADPARHQQYVSFLGRSATFAPADFPRSTRGYLLAPGRPADHGHPAARRHRDPPGPARARPLGL